MTSENSEIEFLRTLEQAQYKRQQSFNNVKRNDDIYYNLRTGQGTPQDTAEYSKIKPFEIYSYMQLETLVAVDPIINKIITVINRAIFQNKFEIQCENNTSYFKKFMRLWRRYGLSELMMDASRSGYVHGHSFLLLDLNDSQHDSTPLDLSKVTKINRINMLNRYFLAPDPNERNFRFDPIFYYLVQQPLYGYDLNNPNDISKFGKYIQELSQEKIHYSRLLPFYGSKLDPYLFRSNLHFNDSYIRKIEVACRNYQIIMGNLATLLSKIPYSIAKIKNLKNLLTSPVQQESLKKAMAFRETIRSTNNVSVIDTEEEYELYSPTLSGYDTLLKAQRDRICESCDIPHDMLFGEGSSGQTTGRTETTNFERFIASERETKILPKIEFFMDLFQYTDKLDKPEDYDIVFDHTEQMTELEESQVAVNYASAASSLAALGFDVSEFITSKYKNIKMDPDLDYSDLDNDDDNDSDGEDESI